MSKYSDTEIVELAREIILSHTQDIEFLDISEMAWDRLQLSDVTYVEQDKILEKLDELIRKAEVTVTFED